MDSTVTDLAARTLWDTWSHATRIDRLPESCRPGTEEEGFAMQLRMTELSGSHRAGWKIAATSAAGQKHIGVPGPLAGTLLASRVRPSPASFSLAGNGMRVIEAEFAFRMGRTLAPRTQPYSVDEVLAAVESLHPAIEVPDSRFNDFATAGGPQLIADNACASWFAPGAATTADWRAMNLVEHAVTVRIGDTLAATGSGVNVLGDPRVALAWLANRLSAFGTALSAGEIVTTGTCVVPVAVSVGDVAIADFGVLGSAQVTLEA
jgi:2-keto-4-pentenoate hydratase